MCPDRSGFPLPHADSPDERGCTSELVHQQQGTDLRLVLGPRKQLVSHRLTLDIGPSTWLWILFNHRSGMSAS